MIIVTSSSLNKFQECPRRYYHEYELKRVPVTESRALAFGKAWHLALETWWCTGLEKAVQRLKQESENIDPTDAAKLCALLKYYNPPRDKYEVVGVEVPFETRILHPDNNSKPFYGYRLAGKVDVLVRNLETNELWIVDHKTTTKEILGFGIYWQALQVDGQMNNYCIAYGARGFIYDVVKKPAIKCCAKDEQAAKEKNITALEAYQARCEEAIAAEPDAWFQWRENTKTDGDLENARKDLWMQVEMFRSCETARRYPRNSGACVGIYGTCPYIDVCTNRADINDDALFRTKETANEELAGVGSHDE